MVRRWTGIEARFVEAKRCAPRIRYGKSRSRTGRQQPMARGRGILLRETPRAEAGTNFSPPLQSWLSSPNGWSEYYNLAMMMRRNLAWSCGYYVNLTSRSVGDVGLSASRMVASLSCSSLFSATVMTSGTVFPTMSRSRALDNSMMPSSDRHRDS